MYLKHCPKCDGPIFEDDVYDTEHFLDYISEFYCGHCIKCGANYKWESHYKWVIDTEPEEA